MNQQVLDFYNRNRDCVYSCPVIPTELMGDHVQAARWLINHPEFAWIELDIELDLPQWKSELASVDPYYVNHRDNESEGWQSCCLYGLETHCTENWQRYLKDPSQVHLKWTDIPTPTITQFWQNMPVEEFQRIRFMKLAPGGYINPHSDAPGKLAGEQSDHDSLYGWPINIAIVHPEKCDFVVENYGTIPFKEGKVFLINIRHNHAVLNFSNSDRIHMIGSCVFGNRGSELADIIIRSYERNKI